MIFNYFKKWFDVWDYLALEPSKKKITFYSEGKNYWPYLRDIIHQILINSDEKIHYISSDQDDPGLQIENENYSKLLIDEGVIRNWFFQNLNTKIMIMTMPDLDNFQIKRSNKTQFYIYTHHALNSFSSALRKNAIDNFDIIFCPCPHHVSEVKMLEEFYKLPPKILVETGYVKVDVLIEKYNSFQKQQFNKPDKETILIAPVWGKHGILEMGKGTSIIDSLISQKYNVVLRPHPETFKHSPKKIEEIIQKYKHHEQFTLEKNITDDTSLFSSKALVTDWSGIAWEYALALKKPILFIDTPQRINNEDYHKLPIRSFEENMREKCGTIWDGKSPIADLISLNSNSSLLTSDYVFNVSNSSKFAAEYIVNLANN